MEILSCKIYKFTSHHDTVNNLQTDTEVIISESVAEGYDKFVWPCAPVLAQFVYHNAHRLLNRNVLEIGCGTALPGILAAGLGASVTLSDRPGSLSKAQETCSANDLCSVDVIGLVWGRIDKTLICLPKIDFVLGSDCFYDTKDFEPVIATVSYLVEKNPECEFWTTYQVRSADRNIEHLLRKWSLHCQLIPLEFFVNSVQIQCKGRNEESFTDVNNVNPVDIQVLVITSHSKTYR